MCEFYKLNIISREEQTKFLSFFKIQFEKKEFSKKNKNKLKEKVKKKTKKERLKMK